VLVITIPLWPIIWITNNLAASARRETLSEIKRHLTQRGRNITESDDAVLLTYHRVIRDHLDEVAKERGEKLPKAVIKEVSLFYMNFWIEAIENKMGLAMPLLLNDGMETYREGGIQALLKLLREDEANPGTQLNKAAGTPERESVSAEDLVDGIWECVLNWPRKYGSWIRENFHSTLGKSIEDVFEEMLYLKGFAIDLTFHSALKGTPKVESAVRDVLMAHLQQFVLEHPCKPLPPGDWLGNGLVWIPTDIPPLESGRPLANLDQRFSLYATSIRRRPDKPISQAVAHLLAAWCGTTDIVFITYVSEIFLGEVEAVRKLLDTHEITC
jgi:hypothetical protein